MKQKIKKNSKRLLLLFVLIFCMSIVQPAFAETAADNNIDLEYLKSIFDLVKEKYNGQVTNDQLTQGSLKGIFDSMDPYTTFFTKDEANTFLGSVTGTYTGIGISMELSSDYVTVAKVFAGSPAEKAGLMQGDRISEVNGKSIVGASLEEAASLIMGEVNTKVKLGIIRKGQSGVLFIEITRAVIQINPITYEIIDGVGYIKLDSFNSNASIGLNNALKEMDKNKITKIILDLRGNPGGEVNQAIEVARNFVPKGIISRLDYKSNSFTDQTFNSYLESPKYKLALLVNGSSASASEIVAGSVQDTKAGTLIGTKTFGKAKVQGMIRLLTPEASAKYEKQTGVRFADAYDLQDRFGISISDDECIGYTKMTIGFYYTPNNRLIDGVGITPDIVMEDPVPVQGVDPLSIQKMSKTVKPGLNFEGADVLNAEKILKILGYDITTPDSMLDEGTFKAIMKFQKDMKIYSYGVLDFSTQNALNTKLNDIIKKYDKQFAKAVEVLNK